MHLGPIHDTDAKRFGELSVRCVGQLIDAARSVRVQHTHTHMARNGRRATMAKARLAIPEPRSQRDAPTSAAGRRSPSRLHEEAVCEP